MTKTWISWSVALVVTSLATGFAHAQESPANVRQEVVSMLKEHLGRWRSEGSFSIGGVSQPAKATWECVAAVVGVGVACTWHHEWADGRTDQALDIICYDPVANAITSTRITDRGLVNPPALIQVRGNTMISTWDGKQEGKPLRGSNQIVVTPGGNWTQLMTVDVGGQRTTEMKMTHYRLK
jgi:hypothetical protein